MLEKGRDILLDLCLKSEQCAPICNTSSGAYAPPGAGLGGQTLDRWFCERLDLLVPKCFGRENAQLIVL